MNMVLMKRSLFIVLFFQARLPGTITLLAYWFCGIEEDTLQVT